MSFEDEYQMLLGSLQEADYNDYSSLLEDLWEHIIDYTQYNPNFQNDDLYHQMIGTLQQYADIFVLYDLAQYVNVDNQTPRFSALAHSIRRLIVTRLATDDFDDDLLEHESDFINHLLYLRINEHHICDIINYRRDVFSRVPLNHYRSIIRVPMVYNCLSLLYPRQPLFSSYSASAA